MSVIVAAERTALIWVDSAPLIQAEHRRYLAAAKRLKETQSRLDHHTKSDEPKYTLWVQTEFASEIQALQKLRERYLELEEIIEFVQDYVDETGATPRAAYREYLESKRMAEKMARMREEEFAKRRAVEEESDEHDSAESEEFDYSENDDSGSHSGSRRGSYSQDQSSTHQKTRVNQRRLDLDSEIKQVYRQLAKRLHPDLNGGLSPEEMELWFEVQLAYDERDLDRLQTLLALSDRIASEREASDEGAAPGKTLSLSRLMSMLKSVTRKIRNVQRALKKAKQSPAWDFHHVRQDSRRYAKLKLSVSVELESVVRGMGADVRKLDRIVSRWKR